MKNLVLINYFYQPYLLKQDLSTEANRNKLKEFIKKFAINEFNEETSEVFDMTPYIFIWNI